MMEEIHSSDPGPRLAELAYHFGEAGIENKAIDYMIRAGQAAEAIFAYGEAAHCICQCHPGNWAPRTRESCDGT